MDINIPHNHRTIEYITFGVVHATRGAGRDKCVQTDGAKMVII